MRPVSAFLSSLCLLSFLSLSSSVWAGTISQHSFDSATLQRPYVYSLYTPDGYESSGLQYPVLYLLHGNLGTEKSWVEQGNLQSTADALIAAGSIPAQLIVVPADPNFWWSDTATEMSRTALVADLIAHIDSSYRTLETREGRAIGGYSAGGFGAANAALQYPELFAVAAPLSPAVYAVVPPPTSSGRTTPIFHRDGQFDPALWQAATWTALIDEYKASGTVVPFYINSGDHDRFDIAYHATVFYQALRVHQPDHVELRIFDGDHNFAAWGGSLGDAMQYMAKYLAAPAP